MRMMIFLRQFRIFIFSPFGFIIGLTILTGPDVESMLFPVATIFAIGLSLAFRMEHTKHPIHYKARIVKKILGDQEFGQRCYAVEVDGMLLPKITWLPIQDDQTVSIHDIIPYGKIITVRLTIKTIEQWNQSTRIHIIMCGKPPHVYDHVYS